MPRTIILSDATAAALDAHMQATGLDDADAAIADALAPDPLMDAEFRAWRASEGERRLAAHLANPEAALPLEEAFVKLRERLRNRHPTPR